MADAAADQMCPTPTRVRTVAEEDAWRARQRLLAATSTAKKNSSRSPPGPPAGGGAGVARHRPKPSGGRGPGTGAAEAMPLPAAKVRSLPHKIRTIYTVHGGIERECSLAKYTSTPGCKRACSVFNEVLAVTYDSVRPSWWCVSVSFEVRPGMFSRRNQRGVKMQLSKQIGRIRDDTSARAAGSQQLLLLPKRTCVA